MNYPRPRVRLLQPSCEFRYPCGVGAGLGGRGGGNCKLCIVRDLGGAAGARGTQRPPLTRAAQWRLEMGHRVTSPAPYIRPAPDGGTGLRSLKNMICNNLWYRARCTTALCGGYGSSYFFVSGYF
ncbi:hypothetical protein EVAR_32042_1 [Eumeta japonica]|uniref:Uncharacterized protein n=1 Tax=Eumeta variegata TaxID=151549 RepID=A0A4C1WM06_EUMVA|nr:hypothetical protein EVAR_32042_1 [Eumeta japonica]